MKQIGIDPSEIHLFEAGEKRFLLDVEGGKLFELSPEARELAQSGMTHRSQVRDLTYARWKALRELRSVLKQIRPLTPGRRQEIVRELVNPKPNIAGLWLGLAHACNLACKYCFANEPGFLGRNRLMPWSVARAAIDLMIDSDPDGIEFHLIFFGGEPLLNLPVLREVLAYGDRLQAERGIRLTYSITTNGTLLTRDVADLLDAHRVSVVLSIDGLQPLQDENRPFHDGSPSWDVIRKNLETIPGYGERYVARATLPDLRFSLHEVYANLESLGFTNIAITEVCPNSGSPPAFPAGELEEWKRQYSELTEQLCRDCGEEGEAAMRLSSLRDYISALRGGGRKYYCCATGLDHFYVTPEGEIYPCFRYLTDERHFRVGSIQEGIDLEKAGRFRENNIFGKSCRGCWARYLCGGQCHGDAYFATQSLSGRVPGFCAMTRHKIEMAAWALAELNSQQRSR